MDTTKPLSAIMTRQTISVFEEDDFYKMEDIFRDNLIHHIPVIDENKKVIGIISRIDMAEAEHNLLLQTTGNTYSKKSLENLKASQIMTPQPTQLDQEDTIGLAAKLIMKNYYHALPITRDDQLVGIVTNHDLLLYAYERDYDMEEESV